MSAVVGQFNYFQWDPKFDHEKPYYLYTDPPPGYPPTNFVTRPGKPEEIHDIRGRQHHFNLDDHAFAFRRQNYPHAIKGVDEEAITSQYLPSLEVLIKDLLQEDCEILWFDWRRRSSDDEKYKLPDGTVVNLENRQVTLAPIKAVHVDQTAAAAIDRARLHVPERADELLKKRLRIINVWRPIGDPVESMPLAFMDGSQVPRDRLVEVDVVRQSFPGESYYPLEHEGYKWYFVDRQEQDEVVFMKMSDTKTDVAAKCCPHASFVQNVNPGQKPRESIEARALVFTEN